MCTLLEEEIKFNFDNKCTLAFELLKKSLVKAPILMAPTCELPFEQMCNASDTIVGVVLGQQKEKIFPSIYYTSKLLTQLKQTTLPRKKKCWLWYMPLTSFILIL